MHSDSLKIIYFSQNKFDFAQLDGRLTTLVLNILIILLTMYLSVINKNEFSSGSNYIYSNPSNYKKILKPHSFVPSQNRMEQMNGLLDFVTAILKILTS